MREARPIAFVGRSGPTGLEAQPTRLGLEENVAQIGMARAAQVRMAEPNDGGVFIAIACAIVVRPRLIPPIHIVRYRIGIGTQGHHTKRCDGTRKRMSHASRSNQRIHPIGRVRTRLRLPQGGQGKKHCC